MEMKKYHVGIIFVLIGAISWGISGTCGQYLCMEKGMDTRWITEVRLVSAGIIITILASFTQKENLKGMVRNKKDCIHGILYGVIALVETQYAYLTAISYTNSGTATVLQYLGMIFILAYVCIRALRLPRKREIIGILSALAGTYIVATHGVPGNLVLSKQGMIWGLLAALGLALHTLVPQRIIAKYDSLTVTGFGMIAGGIAWTFIARIWTVPIHLDGMTVLMLTVISIVGTICAFVFYLQGSQYVGAAKASMIACVEPLVATVTTVVFLHTSFKLIDFVGFAFIIAVVFILAEDKEKTPVKGEFPESN